MNPRIIPLNLPAGLEHETPGNPVSTRLETSVANCFPGLEMDILNLDRRFFPGLIFEFVQNDPGSPAVYQRGAKLVATDGSDSAAPTNKEFTNHLQKLQALLANHAIFLDALIGADGKRVDMFDAHGVPYDWDVTWRLVRSLEPGQITIELGSRDGGKRPPIATLTAHRRSFWNKHGELAAVYRPGELTQSLCSPWQHDFRDCGCTYWAASHPDIVLPEHPDSVEEAQDPGIEAAMAQDPIIWERWNQSANVSSRTTADSCSPFEMDHYEINQRWRDLPFVFEGRERRIPWSVGPCEEAAPLDAGELVPQLKRLAAMEHALALEYLYARYTVRFEDATLPAADAESADFIAHELLTIATGEMLHLRWVNQLLWELESTNRDHAPALEIARTLPNTPTGKTASGATARDSSTRPIDVAIGDFLASEAPSGSIERQYARVLALFRQGLPPRQVEGAAGGAEYHGRREFSPDMIGLVERIMADGVTHYSRFREIKTLLDRPRAESIVRHLKDLARDDYPVAATSPNGQPIKVTYASFEALYYELLVALRDAYFSGRVEDRSAVVRARQVMLEMNLIATQLARSKDRIGIPLIAIGRDALNRFMKSEQERG